MLRKHWLKILFFGSIFAYYVVGVSPDMTWMSLGGDAFDYVLGSENMWAVRPTGYPSYILLGWVFERLPGNPFWALGLLSAVASFLTCIFIFLTVKLLVGEGRAVPLKDTSDGITSLKSSALLPKFAPYIGTLLFAGSFVVWTQSVIPEVYTMTTLCMVAGTYFVLKRNYWWAVGCLAVGLGTHHLIAFAIVPLIIYVYYVERDKKLLAKLMLVGCLGFVPYLQTQLAVGEMETVSGLGSVVSHSANSFGVAWTLPLTSTWQRLSEAVPLLVASFSVGIVLLFFLKRSKEIVLLAILGILPVAYYLFSNIPMWTTYTVSGLAFLSILAGVGASRLPDKRLAYACIAIPVLFMGLNLGTYDLGRSVDSSPTSAREFYESLNELPDDSVVYICPYGEPWLTTYYYRIEEDHRIDFVFEGQVRFYPESYRDLLLSKGITIPEDLDKFGTQDLDMITKIYLDWDSIEFAAALEELNPDRDWFFCYLEEGADSLENNVYSIVHVSSYLSRATSVPGGLKGDEGGLPVIEMDGYSRN